MMNVSDYIIQYLLNIGVTHAFGLPGGVILELIYAMDRAAGFTPHLSYHEQGAAFAASGYAQASGRLGVVYCTRGPGVTNLMTAIADAYYESIPVLILTAHAVSCEETKMRAVEDQEMDTPALFNKICKYASTVETREEVEAKLGEAVEAAISGRKGPVLLDFSTRLLAQPWESPITLRPLPSDLKDEKDAVKIILKAISEAQRPILLVGDGVRQARAALRSVVERMGILVVSSRAAQDILPQSEQYFGYVGSHGIRYANFILSKADLIIALGNRMSFPVDSESFSPTFQRTKTIRVEIDIEEFSRNIPNCINLCADAANVIKSLATMSTLPTVSNAWTEVCLQLKNTLYSYDVTEPIHKISCFLKGIPENCIIVCDVGNHEFWLSRAYTYAKVGNRILYSKSFGALGCALPKAIGAYCASGVPVICFTGDQGFQLNQQELQSLAQEELQITVFLINNRSSGMIRSRELSRPYFLHTTLKSGYGTPNFCCLSEAYGIPYRLAEANEDTKCTLNEGPQIIEYLVDENYGLQPSLPKGNPCQKQSPLLPEELYKTLDQL